MLFWVPAFLLLAAPAGDLEENVKRFIDVFALVEEHAADPVPVDKAFYEGAIPGLLKRLDPHSVFFDPAQFEQLQELERSVRKGFGSVVSVLPGRVIVLQTLPGTPSARSGIGPGDEIVAINDIALDRLETEQLVALLAQSRQKQVHLVVRRPGNARLLEFVLTPEEMRSNSVERTFMLDGGIAYLRVASFDASTGKEIRDAIERMGGTALKGVILDLRNNTGGVMTAALDTASLFLKPGQKILSIRGRASEAKDIDVPATATPYSFPVAVLINGKTASSSEIVAGALQDHDRGIIIGEPSFGKGLVQSVYPLSGNSGLALTTAFYYTPSGRSIQKPVRTGQLGESIASSGPPQEYATDSGRKVSGGGGIQPDIVVYPEVNSRLGVVIEATASFPSFATQYLQRVRKVPEGFEVTPEILDEFQFFLSQRNIRPGIAEWSRDRDWIQSRLKQEILNQAVSVEKGDEVEVRRDPVVRRALAELAKARE